MASDLLASFPVVVSTEAFAAVMALHLGALLLTTLCGAIDTSFYCLRMHFYRKAILSAKDVDKVVIRPPRNLWKHYKLVDKYMKGDSDAENTP